VLTFQEESEMQTALKHKKAMFPASFGLFISLGLQEMTDISSEVAFFPRMNFACFFFRGTLVKLLGHHSSRVFHKSTHHQCCA